MKRFASTHALRGDKLFLASGCTRILLDTSGNGFAHGQTLGIREGRIGWHTFMHSHNQLGRIPESFWLFVELILAGS